MKMLFALILALGTFSAQAETYIYDFGTDYQMTVRTLASFSVGQPTRRYSVRVRDCGDSVSSVMLRVTDAGLQVSGAGALYTDGTNESYALNYTFRAGTDSPWLSIDSFKKAGKCVKSVFVDAQSTDARIKSRVKVFGN